MEIITGGICTIIGASIGGICTIFASRISKKDAIKEKQISILCSQIVAYWNLERFYVEELSEKTGVSKITIQKNIREKVEKECGTRPKMTAHEANGILKKID